MTGFYGQYNTTLDDKGRFALPARLRAVKGPSDELLLSGNIILTKGLEGCLSLYPEIEWEDIQRRMASRNFTQTAYRQFSRIFYSAATVVTPDRNGRILIPSHLINHATLKKELLVIGVNRNVEIWNPDLFRYYLDRSPRYEQVAEELSKPDDPERV